MTLLAALLLLAPAEVSRAGDKKKLPTLQALNLGGGLVLKFHGLAKFTLEGLPGPKGRKIASRTEDDPIVLVPGMRPFHWVGSAAIYQLRPGLRLYGFAGGKAKDTNVIVLDRKNKPLRAFVGLRGLKKPDDFNLPQRLNLWGLDLPTKDWLKLAVNASGGGALKWDQRAGTFFGNGVDWSHRTDRYGDEVSPPRAPKSRRAH